MNNFIIGVIVTIFATVNILMYAAVLDIKETVGSLQNDHMNIEDVLINMGE